MGLPKIAARQAEAAEGAGWDGLLLVDSQNLAGDCYVGLAMAARVTERIGLGTGVTNPVTRHPAVAAGAIATVQAESGGRAVLGIGRGDSSLAHLGLAPASVAELEAHVAAVQAYLRGDELPFGAAPSPGGRALSTLGLAGQPSASRLHWLRPDQPKVPVDVFATGPKVLGVAGRLADRVTFAVGAEAERVVWARDTVRRARTDAGLDPEGIDVGACVNLVCHPDPDVALGLASGGLASFARFSVMHGTPTGPVSDAESSALRRLHSAYDMNRHTMAGSPQAGALDADFAHRFAILGPVDHCVARLNQLAAAGVRRFVIIGPAADADRAEGRASVARLVNEVVPAVREAAAP